MTRAEFEKKYGKHGCMKVSTNFPYDTISDLIPYFDEYNNIVKKNGEKPKTLKAYVEMVLSIGCKHFMLRNAEFLSGSVKAYYKQLDNDTETKK